MTARPDRFVRSAVALGLALAAGTTARAQPGDDVVQHRPSFSVSASAIATTHDTPSIYLTFRAVDHIDFRVYRVKDPVAFLAGLKDPHQLGSEEPLVAQTPTPIERIADWKADWRSRIQSFFRAQFSYDYRLARRQRLDRDAVVLRRTTNVHSFAQVPLLNPAQLVTSWREILPPLRDAEVRRIPVNVRQPGLYVVEAVYPPHRAYTVVIVSDVGLVSKASPGQVLLYAADRFTGKPAGDCEASVIYDHKAIAAGRTGADGVFDARFNVAASEDVISLVSCAGQVVATDPGSWYLQDPARELVGYVYTDKPIYRPGHTVHIKGVLRWRTHGALVPFDQPDVEVRVSDVTDKVIYRQRQKVDAFGGVTADIVLPSGAALGDYSIAILLGDQTAAGSFEVQEYRKPEFEVHAVPAERFVVQDSAAKVAISARYYFGQPVAHGRVAWVARRQPYYSPLRWTDEDADEGGGYWWSDDQTLEGTARLDAQGRAEISVPLDVDDQGNDYSLRIEARVTDASGREVSGAGLVHATYGSFLLAVHTSDYVIPQGGSTTLSVRAVDYVGGVKAGMNVHVVAAVRVPNHSWNEDRGARTVAEGDVTTDADGRATWTFRAPPEPGDYRVRFSADSDDRTVTGDVYLWVPGSTTSYDRDSGDRYLELIADRNTVSPGETARFLVRGAEFDADVLVTKEAQDVSWHEVRHVKSNETIEVPISDEDVGDTWVNLVFLSKNRLFRAERRVRVPAVSRQLQVTLTAEQPVSRPREPGRFLLKVVDASGSPVQGEFSLSVVDEAVYGVKADTTPDPLRFFYQRSYSRVGTQFSREYYFVGYSGNQQLMLAMKHRPYSLADFKSDKPGQPQARKDFPDAIYWVGNLVTDRHGEARVQVTYPDALTTWRLTARGVTADTRVGAAVARTTVTKDLIVRVITPRFLSQGDQVVVPVITHNYREDAARLDVSLAATNLTATGGPASAPSAAVPVTVAPAGEERLDWRFTADSVGTVSVTGKAVGREGGDAVEVSLPVLPFGLRRDLGKSGTIPHAGRASATLDIPEESNPAARTIQISVAPSMAGSLLGALDFLTEFPYGCTEQTLSSYLPSITVARTLTRLKLQPTERVAQVDRYATAGLARLLDYQHDDGGWGWWKTDENQPFMTAYAVYGLLETRAAGYKVPEDRLRSGLTALARLYRKYPRAIPGLKAYMIYVLERAAAEKLEPGYLENGPFDLSAALDEVVTARRDLTPYGQALLLLALDAAKDARADGVARDLLANVTQTGDLAWWTTSTDPLLDDWDDTTAEATATAVRALVAHDPRNPVLEAAVRYLLANRQSGAYWSTTKQTAMVLYGLTAFMQARGESGVPSTVDISVNGTPLRPVHFDSSALTAPDPVILTAPGRVGANEVTITTEGAGPLYWTASARYFDTRTPIERTGGRKLAIARDYFALSPVTAANKHVVYRPSPLGGSARPGDVLLVHLAVAGASDWRYLMVEDMLPAGTEPIADDDLYPLEGRYTRAWGNRRELRDDRVVFFQDGLPEGRVDYYYLLKVVTPGVFRAMPAQVTPMYVPGVSASTRDETVTIGVEERAQ